MAIITNKAYQAQTDWISTRAAQSYPLADNTSDISHILQLLPPFLLLDIFILLPSAVQNIANNIYISAIQDNGRSLRVLFAYNNITFAQCAGISKTLTTAETIADRTYAITPVDISTDTLQSHPWMNKISGSLCAGLTYKYTGGDQTFDAGAALLNPMCVHYIAGDHLEAIVADGNYLTGQVQLVAQKGIQCTVSGNSIHLSIDPNYIQELIGQQAASGKYIKSINGIGPDGNGNVTIQGLDCVQVKPTNNALIISNPCAKPCCKTQSSIQNIQATIDLLQEQHKILRDYFVNMSTNINYMQTNLTTLAATR